jgi:hypothetical protein
MIAIAIASAFGIYKLFTSKRKITLKVFFAVALGLCASVSVMLYLYLFRDFLRDSADILIARTPVFYIVISTIGLFFGSIIVFNMVFRSLEPKKKNPALIAFCILLGAFLSIVLPVWAVIPLITGVAIWDLWAAKRGIIKEMITESDRERDEVRRSRSVPHLKKVQDSDQELPTRSSQVLMTNVRTERKKLFHVAPGEDITSYGLYEGKYYSLGIGDFIFFSVLVSTTFKWMMLKAPWMGFYVPGWAELMVALATLIVMALVILGLKKTLSYLDKESVMPGLPLSVLFGLVGFLGIGIFLETLNLIFFGNLFQPF